MDEGIAAFAGAKIYHKYNILERWEKVITTYPLSLSLTEITLQRYSLRVPHMVLCEGIHIIK